MRFLGAAALSAALALAAEPVMVRHARHFPPLSELPSTPYAFEDVVLSICGMRATAADLAWIQLLQYSADGLDEFKDRPGHAFEHVKTLSLRVARLDPSFHRAYLYGAGVLGWFQNVSRPDEAVEILQEGMRNDPAEPLYSEYIAALAFQKHGDTARMMQILIPAAADPRSPILMKDILANLYKKQGEYAKALAIWDEILDNEDESREWPRARVQAAQLRRLIKGSGADNQ